MAEQRSNNADVKALARRLIQDHRNLVSALQNAAIHQPAPSELDRRHRNMLARLDRSNDQAFDRRFLTMQAAAHRRAIQTFEDFASSGDSESLQNFAEDALPELKDHLKRIQTLQARVDERQASATETQASAEDDSQPIDATDNSGSHSPSIVQPSLRATAQQHRPNVDVTQMRPQITILQPAPTITIDQPQPQITVLMPNPQADVSAQHGPAPDVRFRRTGQPTVQYRPAPGQPQIRYEQASGANDPVRAADSQDQADNQDASANQAASHGAAGDNAGAARPPEATAARRNAQAAIDAEGAGDQPDRNASAVSGDDQDWIAEAERQASEGDVGSTAGGGKPDRTVNLTAGDLENMAIYNAKGRKLGDIERVIVDENSNKRFAVLARGGFLGLFQDEVAIPMSRIRAGDDRLYITGLTPAEIAQMPDWENRIPNHHDLDEDQSTTLHAWR